MHKINLLTTSWKKKQIKFITFTTQTKITLNSKEISKYTGKTSAFMFAK